MADRYRPLSDFAAAFAAEYKGFMRANGITNLQIAKKLDRNDGYVSERANGRRPLDTEDIDALAMLVSGWTGKTLMIELARRTRLALDTPPGDVIHASFGAHDLPMVANESINEQPQETDADFDGA
ncbi:hypothetical protein [Microbacterium sp. YY-01]|uniref:hypothetical protein n=1 Tax=Microbacterium sp. YY-01 TaxID=3421634 RepID=UPI003D167DC4